jgi:hypothetical protein
MSEYERFQISTTAMLLLIFRDHLHRFVHTISRTMGMWLCKDILGEKGNLMRVFSRGRRGVKVYNAMRGKKDKDPGLRFYLTSGGKDIQPRSFTRGIPSVRTIHGILYTISRNLIEIYNGIHFTSLKAKRIDLLLIKLVKDSVLIV